VDESVVLRKNVRTLDSQTQELAADGQVLEAFQSETNTKGQENGQPEPEVDKNTRYYVLGGHERQSASLVKRQGCKHKETQEKHLALEYRFPSQSKRNEREGTSSINLSVFWSSAAAPLELQLVVAKF